MNGDQFGGLGMFDYDAMGGNVPSGMPLMNRSPLTGQPYGTPPPNWWDNLIQVMFGGSPVSNMAGFVNRQPPLPPVYGGAGSRMGLDDFYSLPGGGIRG